MLETISKLLGKEQNKTINGKAIKYIDEKEVKYKFEIITLRIKSLVNSVSLAISKTFYSEKIPKFIRPLYIPTFLYKISTNENYVTKALDIKPQCSGKDPDKESTSRWHSYYLVYSAIFAMLHSIPNSSLAVFALGAILQGYDGCPNQKKIFEKYRSISYLVGGFNALLCSFIHAGLFYCAGLIIPVPIIALAVTTILWAPVSSVVMCNIERKIYDSIKGTISENNINNGNVRDNILHPTQTCELKIK